MPTITISEQLKQKIDDAKPYQTITYEEFITELLDYYESGEVIA